MRTFLFALVLNCVFSGWVRAEDKIAIVANPSLNVKNLTSSQLSKLFKGRITSVSDEGKVVLLNRPFDSEVRKVFYEKILDAKPTQRFLKPNSPVPFNTRVAKSDNSVNKLVARIPNALSYILYNKITEKNLVVIKVDDRSPEDPDYLLKW